MSATGRTLTLLLLASLAWSTGYAQSAGADYHPAVASAHPLATKAGMEILATGGNAFDAAVATAAVLGVVEPYSAGLGGGGFWLMQTGDGNTVFIDARETAPGRAHETLYLNDEGEIHPDQLSVNGPLAAGIPGQPAAFAHISETYGKTGLDANLAAAIQLARQGFEADGHYHRMATWRRDILARYPAAGSVFLDDGEPPEPGHLIRQPALAKTLTTLAREGRDGFYQGDLALKLQEDVNTAGGIWSPEDLADYRVIEREATRIEFGDYTLWSAPPPSSGGVALAQIFGMMSARPLEQMDTAGLSPEAARVHYLSELMRRAYRDRALYLGDPGFTDIPLERLLDSRYLADLADTITMSRTTPSETLPGDLGSGTHTTHLSVLDGEGNRVSATLSINLPFGSGFLSGQTGVLLNNELDDFAIKPGVPNAYGLVGGEANKVEPGKRPLSSMTPTLMSGPSGSAIIGTPGGSRIITMVLLGLLDTMEGHSAETVVGAGRFHHQYLPDQIQHEPDALSDSVRDELRALGHKLADVGREYGNMQLILVGEEGDAEAASDPRGGGTARVMPPPR
ncbi:MAG: gamma-glutamyltransferase [Oleiphilaceae bacterium]|nr:gamma-glutamyltransferase [Oleiphilaceae bacterium]